MDTDVYSDDDVDERSAHRSLPKGKKGEKKHRQEQEPLKQQQQHLSQRWPLSAADLAAFVSSFDGDLKRPKLAVAVDDDDDDKEERIATLLKGVTR